MTKNTASGTSIIYSHHQLNFLEHFDESSTLNDQKIWVGEILQRKNISSEISQVTVININPSQKHQS
jgi:hypothetical protein